MKLQQRRPMRRPRPGPKTGPGAEPGDCAGAWLLPVGAAAVAVAAILSDQEANLGLKWLAGPLPPGCGATDDPGAGAGAGARA